MTGINFGPIRDLTVPLSVDSVRWPEDPGLLVTRIMGLDQGDMMTVSRLELGAHSGTHVDAPAHFMLGGSDVSELDLSVLVGPAMVVDAGTATEISRDVLQEARIPSGTVRVLFRTSSSEYWRDPQAAFRHDYVALTPDAARELVDRGVRLVGIDYLSVDAPTEEVPVHIILLKAGVIIVESLDLRDVPAGDYFLVCLPLRILGVEAAPARVILLEFDHEVFDGRV